MEAFETGLALLFVATLLATFAGRINVPYPTLLACAGAVVAFIPGLHAPGLPPELILALFVAPVLLDAAHDASLRDLRENWLPLASLVIVAVSLTTFAVAYVTKLFLPDLSWPAAIALGALLAPPDAVAAVTILEKVNPPHRIRKVLEGESLLNDASALLIYKLAVAAVAMGGFSVTDAMPTLGLVIFGSVIAGWVVSWVAGLLLDRIEDAPTAIVLQFVTTFGVWILAERLGLSAVVTIVVFAIARSRRSASVAHLRIPSFATWEAVTFVLNVFAFMIIGLQVEPILESLSATERLRYLSVAAILLVVVILVRLAWVLVHNVAARWLHRAGVLRSNVVGDDPPSIAAGVAVGWSGMRGIVTLAAAMALPADFPHRDFMQLAAFVVVLGTLLIQGLTLQPLLRLLKLPPDQIIENEIMAGRAAVFEAALRSIEGLKSAEAEILAAEYAEALQRSQRGLAPRSKEQSGLRLKSLLAAREQIQMLRSKEEIGDDAYRAIEQELDWLELSTRSMQQKTL